MTYQESRAAIEPYFENENKFLKTEVSPCGKYTLDIFEIQTKPGAWKFTRGIVKKDGAGIADIKRNYSSFWFTFHDDYLFCGEDYQGYNIINLATGENRLYLDEKRARAGLGFCWYGCEVSSDKKVLAVQGCFWGGPTDIKFLDISDIEVEPKELATYYEEGFYDVVGWRGNDYVVYDEIDRRKSDGKSFDELTSDEITHILKNWETELETEKVEVVISESFYRK